jgi:branched-chain amino acid transport system substrate-binding protein
VPTQSLGAGKFAVSQGKSKLAILSCGEAEACRTLRDAWSSPQAQPIGAQVVYTAQISLAQPDFTSECLQAQSHGAQAVLLAMDANSITRATRSCVQQGFKPLFLTASVALISSLEQEPAADGLGAATSVFPWFATDLPAEQQFQAVIKQYSPSLTTDAAGAGPATAAAWVAALMLQKAGVNLPANPTSADLMNGVTSIKNDSFGGLIAAPVTFVKGQNDPSMHASCYFMVQTIHGKWTGPTGSKPACL